jgi:hypothetical protein
MPLLATILTPEGDGFGFGSGFSLGLSPFSLINFTGF